MPLSKTSILNVSVTTSSREAILSSLTRFFSTHRPIFPSIIRIVTPNMEQVVLAQKNEQFREILNSADISLPDGAGLVWGINRKHLPAGEAGKAENKKQKALSPIPGRLFMIDLCRLAAENGKRVLLYGGRNGVAGEALNKMKQTIPNLDGFAEDGVELSNGFRNYELGIMNKGKNTLNSSFLNLNSIENDVTKHLAQIIRSRNISVVFVGLGAPKQEYLMQHLTSYFVHRTSSSTPLVLMSVGGSFDTISGRIPEAPAVFQKLGIEFLWRLFREPWRIKRQLSLVEFVWMVITRNS